MKRFFLWSILWMILSGVESPASLSNTDVQKYWIFFRDRNSFCPETVSSGHLQNLSSAGIRPIVVSHWLNAISALIPAEKIQEIQKLPFVSKIQPVASYPIYKPILESIEKSVFIPSGPNHALNYGSSLIQNDLIHVPEVHDLGLTGKGIRIGMLDTGFNYRNQSVFSHLNVMAEYDFVFNDRITFNEANDPSIEDDHGTQTLSVIAGFEEGQLIGPAYESSYALAKTEWHPSETRIEEDHWVAGLEWLVDSMHVQIVSSSLGYNTFDDGTGYTVKDLDGNTCVTTVAADLAVKKGVSVVVSAGNERSGRWHYILSPADGDSTIAVGAVTSGGNLAGFSSVGPTADGRIKPDVVAMGVGVYLVDPNRSGKSSYLFANGTSFSCPQTAGVCALILQAHPELSPMQIRDALRNTANRAQNPDTLYGWGLINAYDAIFYHGPIFTRFRTVSLPAQNQELFELDIYMKNGMALDSAAIVYRDQINKTRLKPAMQDNANSYQAVLPSTFNMEEFTFYISATDKNGKTYFGPIDAPNHLYSFRKQSNSHLIAIEQTVPKTFHLYPNYPNPFNNRTTVLFDLNQQSYIELMILNTNGQRVTTLFRGNMGTGNKKIIWNGTDENGKTMPSGVYLCMLKNQNEMKIHKMTFIR